MHALAYDTLETSEMCRGRYIPVVLDHSGTQHSRHEVSKIRLTTGSERKRAVSSVRWSRNEIS